MRRLTWLVPLLLWLAVAADAHGASSGSAFRGMTLLNVKIEGLDRSMSRELRDGLALTERRGLLGLRRIAYYPSLLTDDIERIRLFLAQRGYPYATVTSRFEPSEDSSGVTVVLDIDAGPPVLVGELKFIGVDEPRQLTEREQRELGIAVGDVFTDVSSERARAAVLNYLRERSYALAEVALDVQAIDSTRVSVRFTGERGNAYVFGEVRVLGVGEDFFQVVNRAANIKRGKPFKPRTVRDATDDIRGLGLFRQVKVSLDPVDSNTLDFVCELSERQHRTLDGGLGYMTDEGVLVTGGWEHRNLFKGGRGFRVLGSYTRFLQFVEASVSFPAMFRSPTTGIGALGWDRQVEPAYEATDLRLSFTLGYRYSRRGKLRGGVLLQIIDVIETADLPNVPQEISEADGPVPSLSAGWTYDNSDDPIFPTRGVRIDWDNQVTIPGLGSITEFYRTSAGIAVYHKLVGPTVLAARVYTGIGWPMGSSEALLINYRFWAGGSNSHRGYNRRQLGPKDANNDPLGGEFTVQSAAELRFPLWKIFDGSIFLDGGQLWFFKSEAHLKDLSFAAGPGLAIRSPVGAIRFDYGIRIDPPDDGEPKSVFHFAIGYAF